MENPFIKSFEEITIPELKAGIVEKFENVSRFCRVTKRDEYQFHKLLRLKLTDENVKLLKAAYNDAVKYENKKLKNEVTPELSRKLKVAIFSKSDNISDFCEKNPEFNNTWISSLLHGRVVKITPKVKDLAKALNVSVK